jgi:methyl-accepting chemotaxis protein
LATGVTQLSAEVGSKADTVLARKDELARVIEDAVTAAVSMGAQQRVKTIAILDKTRQSLDLLTSIVDRCSQSARMISVASHEVTADLGEVVVSLQAHDTVRQQIEHVAEALDELAARMPELATLPMKGAAVGVDLLVETGALCQIQAEQLRHAAKELTDAVGSMIAHLRDIASKETAMANDTGALVGVTDQAGSSFFTEMAQDLEEVIVTLTATVATNRQLSAVMTRAAETVGGIFRFVDDIETIAYDIKLMALNFLIQASALGREGKGLGVLADAIRRLSDEARAQAEGVTGILTEVKAVTDGMCLDAVTDAGGMETKVSAMRQGVEEMLSALQEMSGGVGQGLTLANAKAQELSVDIEGTTTGITVHQRVASCLAETGTTLEGMVGAAKALTPEAEWSAATERLQAADNRYTMHSERNIHAAVVNALAGGGKDESAVQNDEIFFTDPAGQASEAAPVSSTGEDDLGDNVELF